LYFIPLIDGIPSMASHTLHPVILCGGAGTRLWPLSRETYPKQFLALQGGSTTMLQDTARRLDGLEAHLPRHAPWVVCNHEHRFLAAQQLHEAGVAGAQLLLEPCARNTAPALTLAALAAQAADPHAVLLAMPAIPAQTLLADAASPLAKNLSGVAMAPCWTLMLAYPQAMQPGLTTLGPQWNAARSTHHRIAWVARESSKPGRSLIERWTVQASPEWSAEHLEDDPARVLAKLRKAFAEITGIRSEPAHAELQRWRHARTLQPLGQSHLWDAPAGLGVCGDWCLGHRIENAFISGLELALHLA